MVDDGVLTVVVASPLSEQLCARIERAEPRVRILRDQSLLPPMRWPGDHHGDPAFRRTIEQQQAFDTLVDGADALFGLPDEDPAALARTVKANPRLRWVHTTAAGGGAQVKAAGLAAADLERVAFSTSAGVHGAPLAEFAVFGLLAGAKSLPRLLEQQARREWSGRWSMQQLDEMRVVVLGLGKIGRQVVSQLSGFGTDVVGVSRSDTELPGLSARVDPGQLGEAVANADGLVVALPGTEATHLMVSADVLAQVKPGIIVVNVGRGTVIDEPALIGALQDGRVSFAALDVFYDEPLPSTSELWTLPNVLISPHTAALNAAEDERIADLFARNATRLLNGEPLVNRMNTVEFY